MDTPTDGLLARYLAGELTPEEADAIERWAAMDPAHRARLDRLRAVWSARQPALAWDVPQIWAGVQRAMRADRARARSASFGRHAPWGRRRWPTLVTVATAAAVLLTAGLSFLIDRRDTGAPSGAAAASAREYATARGQRATLQLPDGTRLMLAPASRLRIPAEFGREAREVYLEGEALFDVVHDSTRPFRVRSKHAVAEDIGTKFDVRAYPEDSAVAVAVAEGAVALGRASDTSGAAGRLTEAAQGVVLQAGELGTLGPAGQVRTARGAVLEGYLDWADGRLAFVDIPVAEAVRRLSRWYDIDIRVASPGLGTRRLTATLVNESAPDALRFVASVLSLQVSRAGNQYTLRAK